MQLLLRSYFGSKQLLQLLQLLSAIVLCHTRAHTHSRETHCLDVELKCVTSAYNSSVGVWYDPAYFATAVCTTDMKSCRKFPNQCEFERADCRGETWEITKNELCESISVGSTGSCNCPAAVNCSKNSNICARHAHTCKNFEDECALQLAICSGERWIKTNPLFCCQLKRNEQGVCKLRSIKPACASTDYRTCRAFPNYCELSIWNERAASKWHQLGDQYCDCLELGFTGPCDCKGRGSG